MDASILITLFSTWVTHMFPSLAEYTQYIAPALMALITGIGIFTNMLPEPNHIYPVPDTSSLEAELQGSGGFILRIAKFTRSLVIGWNWFLTTSIYSWFYTSTNAVSSILSKVKLAPKPIQKTE